MKQENSSPNDTEKLVSTLRTRFESHAERHAGIDWQDVATKLESSPLKLLSLHLMEESGGEPDVVAFDEKTKSYIFFDCSPESPKGRRSLCYDKAAHESRKEFKPKSDVLSDSRAMGIEILDEEQYRYLQTLGKFDLKTSSWVKTPKDIRELGGALFCDRRYDTVFTYHNGAESYYAARGFRASLEV